MRTLRIAIVASLALPALYGQNDWPSYGHDPGGQRYSPLKQITTANVSKLAPAWTYSMRKEGVPFRLSQSIPLMVNGVLYLGYPYNHVLLWSRRRARSCGTLPGIRNFDPRWGPCAAWHTGRATS